MITKPNGSILTNNSPANNFDPFLILIQICCLQSIFYLILSLFIIINGFFITISINPLNLLFDYKMYELFGYLLFVINLLTSLVW